MENNFEKLKQKRTVIRTLTTKLINKCEQMIEEQHDDELLKTECLEQLNAKNTALKDLDEQIQGLFENSPEFENEIETCEMYYEKIISIKSKIKLFLKSDKNGVSIISSDSISRVSSAINESNLTSQPNPVSKVSVKLPKLLINKFNGDSSNWLSFWSQYKNAVHDNNDLTTIDKFNYLISLVSGTAANAISGFSFTSDNYVEAIELLKQRFGRKDLVINAHMSRLLNLEPVKNPNNTFALRKLYDNIEIQIRNLNGLEVTSGTYGTLLTPILLKLLPNELNLDFNRNRKSLKNFDVKELMDFLRQEIECREIANQIQDKIQVQHSSQHFRERRVFKHTTPSAATLATGTEYLGTHTKIFEKRISCVFCEKPHISADCKFVQNLSLEQRKQILVNKGACFRCLKCNHIASQCHSKIKCSKCNRYHHVLLCPNSNNPSPQSEEKSGKCANSQDETLANIATTPHVLLQTLCVTVINEEKKRNVRAIIDSASQRSYILTSTARKLGYSSLRKENLRHSLFGGTSTDVCEHEVYRTYLSNLSGTYKCNFDVLGQEKICETMPPVAEGMWMKELIENDIDLSDHCKGPIEILIGADVAGKLLTGCYKRLPSGLVAIETKLGWTVMGRTGKFNREKNTALIITSMLAREAPVTDLWDLDILGITDPAEKQTKNDQEEAAKEYFLKTLKRNPDGRYEISLPWVEGHQPLVNNRLTAERRLKSTVKTLKSENILKHYEEVLHEWLLEGIIERVDLSKIEDTACLYLPHRAVIKEHSTTRIRPVFDASAKYKNKPSLNDCLEKGPNLVELIPSILNKFRFRKIGVLSDIRKAFLQISIKESDRDYLRFLWFENGDTDKLRIYRHTRVVFGINASPFLLGATISYHLEQVPSHQREVAQKLKNSLYVDNCVTSFDTEEEVETFIEQATEIMADAKFDLRGWKYNETNISTSRTDHKTEIHNQPTGIDNIKVEENISVLGLEWNTVQDTLCCTFKEILTIEIPVTKRSILSYANQIFDPLGFLSPVTLVLKIIMQDCWRAKFSWDAELPDELIKKFLKWKNNLMKVKDLKIPRRLLLSNASETNMSFHVFCDASKLAYATCIYLRSEDTSGVSCQLVQARSRVAPLKSVTISRLELLACTIGVRLLNSIKEDLQLENVASFYWTDSMNALHWIRNDVQWGVFVMNRVQEIRKYSKSNEWNHVPGTLNPADLPSRGCTVETLITKKWYEGPPWLKQIQEYWPSSEIFPDEDIVNSEKRKTIISSLTTSNEEFSYLMNISSFEKVIRITAWIRRFINNCKVPKVMRSFQNLETEELKDAEMAIWRIVQKTTFSSVNDERLQNLHPYIDSSGIIRIKTRLLMRQDFENFKCPIVLPSNHAVVMNLIMHMHKSLSHCGVLTLMSILRENFWILKSRKTIRKVLQNCIFCKRYNAKHPEVVAAPLPEDRVRDCAIFEVTGIDLAGPLILKDGTKAWIVLFTCAVYRAVHLELVSSLSTDKFLLALRRFISRRGRPSTIYTDNGSNFVGTNLALKKIDWNKVIKDTPVTRINWKFIPPASPWWGGFWERMIGLIKNILRKVLGRASLKYEEISTILCDCENIINLRPITYISEDLELEPLTPAMFLRDVKESGVPDLDHIDSTSLQKRQLYRAKIREDLRKRFRSEYLGQLKNFSKKSKNCHHFSIGDIVLIESNSKRSIWPLGRVIHLFPGKDGVVRLVKLRTKFGELLRPIQRLYPLEVTSPKDKDFRDSVPSATGCDGKEQPVNVSGRIAVQESPDVEHFPVANEVVEPSEPRVNRYGRVLRVPRRLDL